MQRYYLLTAGVVACFSSAITWYLVDPHSFVLYTNKHLQRQLVSSSSRSSSSTASNRTFECYKLSLQWPPSTCSSKMHCMGRVLNNFTIHGLWPQDERDIPIPPYYENNSCTRSQPKIEILDDLKDIEEDLKLLWPDLNNRESDEDNRCFWRKEWTRHGMCSKYAQKPLDYFNSTFELRNKFQREFNLTPGAEYTLQNVTDTIRGLVGAIPEIACSKSRVEKNTLLLWEVRICYNKTTYPKPEAVQDCRNETVYCGQNMSTPIKIPNSTDEMPNHLAGIGSDFQAGTDEM